MKADYQIADRKDSRAGVSGANGGLAAGRRFHHAAGIAISHESRLTAPGNDCTLSGRCSCFVRLVAAHNGVSRPYGRGDLRH